MEPPAGDRLVLQRQTRRALPRAMRRSLLNRYAPHQVLGPTPKMTHTAGFDLATKGPAQGGTPVQPPHAAAEVCHSSCPATSLTAATRRAESRRPPTARAATQLRGGRRWEVAGVGENRGYFNRGRSECAGAAVAPGAAGGALGALPARILGLWRMLGVSALSAQTQLGGAAPRRTATGAVGRRCDGSAAAAGGPYIPSSTAVVQHHVQGAGRRRAAGGRPI